MKFSALVIDCLLSVTALYCLAADEPAAISEKRQAKLTQIRGVLALRSVRWRNPCQAFDQICSILWQIPGLMKKYWRNLK